MERRPAGGIISDEAASIRVAPYSARNAWMGSLRVARKAGINVAASDTIASKAPAIANVAGSRAPIPYN